MAKPASVSNDPRIAKIDRAIALFEDTAHALAALKTHPAHWYRVQDTAARAHEAARRILIPIIREWDAAGPGIVPPCILAERAELAGKLVIATELSNAFRRMALEALGDSPYAETLDE